MAELVDHYGVLLDRMTVSYAPAPLQVAFWEQVVTREPWSSAAKKYLADARAALASHEAPQVPAMPPRLWPEGEPLSRTSAEEVLRFVRWNEEA